MVAGSTKYVGVQLLEGTSEVHSSNGTILILESCLPMDEKCLDISILFS